VKTTINTAINSSVNDDYTTIMKDVNTLDEKYKDVKTIIDPNMNLSANTGSNWNKFKKTYANDKVDSKFKYETQLFNNENYDKITTHIKTTEYNNKLGEILSNKHPFSYEYMKKYNKKYKDIKVETIFNKENEILNIFKEIFQNFYHRLEHGEKICGYRRHEGVFINKSLQEMREDIKKIFYEKQQDSIFISPDYVNLCLEKYCPTHSDCFKKEVIKEPYTIKSVIFKKIFDYLNSNNYFKNVTSSPSSMDIYKTKKFYQDILVSVFCVFNISRTANNPPSIPYIDINELKIALKMYETNATTYAPELKTKLLEVYYKITGKKLNNYEVANVNTFDEMQTSTIQQSTYENVNTLEYIFTKDSNIINLLNSKTELTPTDINHIYNFVEAIDNNNAISAVGTLEFLDQISKYYTTQTICFLEDDINASDYVEIYNTNGEFMLNK
jgi:hypothetical protein